MDLGRAEQVRLGPKWWTSEASSSQAPHASCLARWSSPSTTRTCAARRPSPGCAAGASSLHPGSRPRLLAALAHAVL